MPYRFAMDIGLEMHRAKNTTDKNIKSRCACAWPSGCFSSNKNKRILNYTGPHTKDIESKQSRIILIQINFLTNFCLQIPPRTGLKTL